MSNEIKKMDISDFRRLGYLQELNRLFLHPLGLAIEVEILSDGTEVLSGILDSRDDPEGIMYDFANSSEERIITALDKSKYVISEFEKRQKARIELFNSVIEPIIPQIDIEEEVDEVVNIDV